MKTIAQSQPPPMQHRDYPGVINPGFVCVLAVVAGFLWLAYKGLAWLTQDQATPKTKK